MKSYKLTPENQQKEKNVIQQILVNKNYEASALNKISRQKKQKPDTFKKKVGKVHIYREGNKIHYKAL
jgi:parvulin-like peptidyl-prolyl isomerase